MLDKNMQYTCAYWEGANTLDQAQENKLELVCRKLYLKKGESVLELGSGWGYLAKYMAEKYGCRVTAYNVSSEQVKHSRKINKGLPVKIEHKDYRLAEGQFDKVVSVGLAEHVGPKNYRAMMETANRCLRDNSLFLLHSIGRDVSGTSIDPWIDKYIFPNAVLPSPKQLTAAAESLFVIEDWHNFGPDYDRTLMAWYDNFQKSWPGFQDRFGERFGRMWSYYLLCCAGSFRARHNQLWQIVLSKDGYPGGYKSKR
jgi:cyclopropane-fatty-acyl-phospholipid synthase